MAPHTPQTFVTPRQSRGAPLVRAVCWRPDMAPHTRQDRSERCGGAATLLDTVLR